MAAAAIKPETGRTETAIVALLALAVTAGTALYALSLDERAGMPELTEWQVSAFDGLTSEDQAIHSALGPALDEIVTLYNMRGEWPTADQLAEELIPPFYQDILWEQSGQVAWEMVRPENSDTGAIYYLGRGGRAEGQSAYLALINHVHRSVSYANQLDLWIHADPKARPPAVLKPESLVSNGWRQVVTYSGANEVSRIKGN